MDVAALTACPRSAEFKHAGEHAHRVLTWRTLLGISRQQSCCARSYAIQSACVRALSGRSHNAIPPLPRHFAFTSLMRGQMDQAGKKKAAAARNKAMHHAPSRPNIQPATVGLKDGKSLHHSHLLMCTCVLNAAQSSLSGASTATRMLRRATCHMTRTRRGTPPLWVTGWTTRHPSRTALARGTATTSTRQKRSRILRRTWRTASAALRV